MAVDYLKDIRRGNKYFRFLEIQWESYDSMTNHFFQLCKESLRFYVFIPLDLIVLVYFTGNSAKVACNYSEITYTIKSVII
jgi:hypothetical protein